MILSYLKRETITLLQPYTKGTGLVLSLGVFFTIAVAASEALIAHLLEKIIDAGVVEKSESFIALIPWLVVGYFAFRSTVSYCADALLAWVCSTIKKNIRASLFNAINVPFNDKLLVKYQQEIHTNIVFGAENIGAAVTMGCTVLLKESVTLMLLLIYMVMLSPELFLLFVTAAPVVGFFVGACNKKIRHRFGELQEVMTAIGGGVEQCCKSQIVLQVYQATTNCLGQFHTMNNASQMIENKLNRTQALTNAIAQLVFGLPAAAAFYLYFNLHYLTQGAFIAFIFCAFRILQPIKLLARANADMQKAFASLEKLSRCLHTIEAQEYPTEGSELASFTVEFRGVTLKNDKKSKTLLHEADFTLPQGKKIALRGASGIGKSTLIKAILGLAKPESGDISLGGVDIANIDRQRFHEMLSFVGQEPQIITGTIADNIMLGCKKRDHKRMLAAARSAHAHEFISQCPNGYETEITHAEKNLSGGQLQRINIARAVYKDAPLYLLDEMTSALDHKSEETIVHNLRTVLHGKSALIITHREALLELADEVWIFENGKVIRDSQ